MKYKVMDSFRAQTRQGEVELRIGQTITLPHDEALRLLNKGKIAPVDRNLFEECFNVLADKLGRYALTSDEIKVQKPEIHKGIQAAIDQMDTAWLKGDLREFLKAVKTIEELYFKALQEIPKW